MFYEVKVYDSNNQIKKIIRTKELSQRHWMIFGEEQTNNVFSEISKKKLGLFKSKQAS